jgi:type IV secretion system protein VirD4
MHGHQEKGDLFVRIVLLVGLIAAIWHFDVLLFVPPEWRPFAKAAAIGVTLFGGLQIASDLMKRVMSFARYVRSVLPSASHGSAGWATRKDARKGGLHQGHGLFVGVHEGRVIRYENETHTLVLAPAGAGKTVCAVIPQLGLVSTPMLVTDMKGELAAQTARHRERVFKHKIVTLNPPKGFGFEEHAYNVLQIVVDDLEENPEDAVSDARGIAFQLLREPARSDANQYFRAGARSIITFVSLGLAVREPEAATLVTVQRIVNDVPVLVAMLEDFRDDSALQGDVAAMAESLLACHKDTPREFQAFLNGAAQALEPFAASGRLARMSDRCTFRFRDLKTGKLTIYLGCDMTRIKIFGPVVALWNWAAMLELQRMGDNRPVIFMLDEASNVVIEGLPNALTALRGYGIRCYMVFQELEEITRVYGREAQATILSQTPLKQFFGIGSQATAEMISKALGNETISTPNFALGTGLFDDIGESRGFTAKPLLSGDEVRRLPSDEQIVFIGNMRPLRCLKIGYHEIEPLRSRIDPNPFHGGGRYRGELKVRL